MKPHLVIGLGNPLMGDDGVAWHLVEALRAEPGLPGGVELLWAGTDLLGAADKMIGRERVTLLDAILDPAEPGTLCIFDNDFSTLESEQPSAHQLSAPAAIQLLRLAYPELAAVPLRLLAITVASASMQPDLSPTLAARFGALLDQVRAELA